VTSDGVEFAAWVPKGSRKNHVYGQQSVRRRIDQNSEKVQVLMTDMKDWTNLIGHYLGEPTISTFLSECGIVDVPKLKRGDPTAIVANGASGVEVTFRNADALDVKTREYPDGALVLANIRFYGIKTDDFEPYAGTLPLGVSFGAAKQILIERLGTPARDNLTMRQMRWDFDTYCVFAKLAENDGMSIFSVQLPIA
jgi:hypothetical protein